MIRKNNILPQLAIVLGLAAILGGCVRDEIFESTQSDGSAQVTLALSLGKASEITVTKADADNSYGDLSSLLLLIYDANGTNIKKIVSSDEIYSYPDDETLSISSSATETGYGYRYDISLNMPVGESKVLAIGHYTSASAWNGGTYGNGTISLSEYMKSVCEDAVTNSATLADVQKKIYYLASGYSKTGSTLDMTESSIVPSGTATVTVTESSGSASVDTESGTIEMKRQVAWINFKIKDGADTLSFVPSHYTVYNIPTQVSIEQVDDETNNGLEASCYYSTQNISVAAASSGAYSFSFMMPENITTTTSSSVTDYYDRDKWDGYEESTRNTYNGGNYTQKNWTNAPANSTYVVIHGDYTSWTEDKTAEKYSGEVNYTIHLGDFSDSDYSNFAVERNTKYTYNITVKGVNEIVAECTTEEYETQSGAEGHIYNVADPALNFILDAHFEQVLLKYNLSNIYEAAKTSLSSDPSEEEINEAIGRNMILLIESPYQDEAKELEPYTIYSKYSTTTDQTEAKDSALTNVDYKWVELLPQESTTEISRYPGIPYWGRLNNVDGRTGDENTDLMDVYDACVAMGKVVKEIYDGGTTATGKNDDGIWVIEEDNKYYAVFTGFVDEYFYTKNPLDNSETTWADFTNKDPRSMIVIFDTQVSADKNSSYSEIHTRIVQRSIQTFYNETNAYTLNAFGMETFNETPMCDFPSTGFSTDGVSTTSYGRDNTIKMMTSASISGSWSSYINISSNGWTKSISEGNTGGSSKRLNSAAYNGTLTVPIACLSRNRDLNGNETIDDNEVIWYLASTDEYIAMGIGETVMSGESNLYFGDKSELTKKTYPGSDYSYGLLYHTSNYAGPNNRTYWAVEKAAYGFDTGAMYVRCIRSLPTNDNDNSYDKESDALVTKKSLDENTVLDFRNVLTSSLYRQSSITEALPEHNEDDKPLSGFYKGIVVSTTTSGYISATLSNIVNLNGTGTNPCGEYYENDDGSDKGAWRPPNLDELYIMGSLSLLSAVKINNTTYKDIVCATEFTNTSVRTGFAYDTSYSRIWCIQNDYTATSYTRCVRDATDDELDSAE